MTASEFETLHADLLTLRNDVDQHFAKVEAKLDAKPSIATLYQAVVTLMFGIEAVVIFEKYRPDGLARRARTALSGRSSILKRSAIEGGTG
jgi:hypothetical protein